MLKSSIGQTNPGLKAQIPLNSTPQMYRSGVVPVCALQYTLLVLKGAGAFWAGMHRFISHCWRLSVASYQFCTGNVLGIFSWTWSELNAGSEFEGKWLWIHFGTMLYPDTACSFSDERLVNTYSYLFMKLFFNISHPYFLGMLVVNVIIHWKTMQVPDMYKELNTCSVPYMLPCVCP